VEVSTGNINGPPEQPGGPSFLGHVLSVYQGSDGDATKALYARLTAECGVAGAVAVNLMRATKASERAKLYRGGARGKGSYRGMAYDKKAWAMGELAGILVAHSAELNISWGWGVDRLQPVHSDVLYVDLPTGQVSFHTSYRDKGPDYSKEWDGVKGVGPTRVCTWVASLLEGKGD
jgi:hypothetical protein